MNELNLVNRDLILNSTRILILISKFETRKTFKLNLYKIMLYDFYMKFPQTMIPGEMISSSFKDFNEFYSYFHWQPDRDEYNIYLRYLIGKKLVDKIIIGTDICYRINERGNDVLENFESGYSKELKNIAEYVKKHVSKLADSVIEEKIIGQSLKNTRDGN